jgi:hypothetical protein
MEGFGGVLATLLLAAGIGYLTFRGFRREAASLKNGTCCGSTSCSCKGNCGNKECHHDEEDPAQKNIDSKSREASGLKRDAV